MTQRNMRIYAVHPLKGGYDEYDPGSPLLHGFRGGAASLRGPVEIFIIDGQTFSRVQAEAISGEVG